MKQMVKGKYLLLPMVLLSIWFFFTPRLALAQVSTSRPRPTPTPPRVPDGMSADKSAISDDPRPMTTFEEELKAKRAIKLAEKEHEENLKRAREISDIAKQLQASFKSKSMLDRDDSKRLDRLEKLTKKIRGEAGGESEEVEIINRPTDTEKAVTQIAEKAASLSENVQKTPRQVVSASVIGSANVLLELIRMARSFNLTPR
ncbi:MAG TPA: hypothetical protein VFD63_15225 [Pyrinomonadaceae bacterium]|nr:hypothetical protein [Pyrinomonadaceae bacterium]